MLRSGALSDPQTISFVNAHFIPVWIDVRREPLPPIAHLDDVLLGARISPDGEVQDAFSQGFFLRSVVVTPDGARILNPQSTTRAGSFRVYAKTGHHAWAQAEARHYLPMLTAALERAGGDGDTW